VALAFCEMSEAAPLSLFPKWVATSSVEPVHEVSSAALTPLTQRLGQWDSAREEFFRQWVSLCGPVKTIVCDMTSLSSYATLFDDVEWGSNRDHDPFPQVNLGMVYAEHAPARWHGGGEVDQIDERHGLSSSLPASCQG